MSLRKAAEALITHWDAGEYKNCTGDMSGHVRVLRDALVKPEWVGMTDQERADCWRSSAVESAINIEQALKERNT